MSWNVLGGFGGQISWCHSAFAAIGAYTALIFYNFFGISPLLSMPIGVLLSYGFATLLGKVTLRYRGPFFAITTIAFAEILRVLLLNLNTITGGSAGPLQRGPAMEPGIQFRQAVLLYCPFIIGNRASCHKICGEF